MVFYIIAAAEKDSSQASPQGDLKYVDEQVVIRKITSTKTFTDNRGPSELHHVKVKTKSYCRSTKRNLKSALSTS